MCMSNLQIWSKYSANIMPLDSLSYVVSTLYALTDLRGGGGGLGARGYLSPICFRPKPKSFTRMKTNLL